MISTRKNPNEYRRRLGTHHLQLPSQGKLSKSDYKLKATEDDDAKLLMMKKKRQEVISKKINITTHKSSQLDIDLIVQEQIEGSKREGSRREGSRYDTLREPSKREGTINRRSHDVGETSIRHNDSRRSVVGSSAQTPLKSMQPRSDSHRGTRHGMGQSSNAGQSINESSHQQLRSFAHLDDHPGSSFNVQSQRKRSIKHESQESSYRRASQKQSIIKEAIAEHVDDNSFKRRAQRVRSIIPESANEDLESSFLRMGSRHKSFQRPSAEPEQQSIMHQSFMRQGNKKPSLIRDSIQDLMNNSQNFHRSVAAPRKPSIVRQPIKKNSFMLGNGDKREVIMEQKEEQDDFQIPKFMESKNIIKELMDNNQSIGSSSSLSMFQPVASESSSIQKERTIRMIQANLQTQPKMVLHMYEIELDRIEADLKSQNGGFKKMLEFIDKQADPSSYKDGKASCDVSVEYTDRIVENEHSHNMLLIQQSHWRSASRDQLCNDLEKRLEHLVKVMKYQKDDANPFDGEEEEEEDYAEEYYDDYPEDVYESYDEGELEEFEEEEELFTESGSPKATLVNLEDDYEVLAARDAYSDYYSLKMVQEHDFAWIWTEYKNYIDDYPLLAIRKLLFVGIEVFYVVSYKVVSSKKWILFILFATIGNIMSYLIFRYEPSNFIYQWLQRVFLYMYTTEVLVRLLGHGWKRYIQDAWNFYDLMILILYGIYIYDHSIMPFDVSTFRVIRIPFFLSHLNKHLHIMLTSLQESVKFLLESLLVVLIFSGFFALIQLHLFQGALHYQCLHLEYGLTNIPRQACGYDACPIDQACYLGPKNPDEPTSFDDIIYAYGQTLRTISQNEWTYPMYWLMRTFHPSVFLLYLVIIFVGERFCFNLVIAVLKTQYAETAEFFEHNEMHEELRENQVQLNLRILIDMKLYQQLKELIDKYTEHRTKSKSIVLMTKSIEFESEGSPSHPATKVKEPKEEEKPKKEEKEVKLLSARQKNMIENYKKKMREAYENSSWMITWLLPQQRIQKRMQRLVREQENVFLQYYDLQLYYRFRSIDFLSLKVEVKEESPYRSTSEKQVMEVTENKRREQMEHDLMHKPLAFHYPAEDYQQFQHRTKPPMPVLPLMKRKRTFVDDVTRRSTVEAHMEERSRYNRPNSKMSPYNSIRKADIRPLEEGKKGFNRANSLVSQHVEKLFKDSFSDFSHPSSSSSEELEKEEDSQKARMLKIDGEEKGYDDLVDMINLPIEEAELQAVPNYKVKYLQLRMNDNSQAMIKQYNWSGDDVNTYTKDDYRTFSILTALNDTHQRNHRSWIGSVFYLVHLSAAAILNYEPTTIVIDLSIMINTIILAMKGLTEDRYIDMSNYALNFILIFELCLKLIAQNRFFRTWNGVAQTVIIMLSTSEMVITDFHTVKPDPDMATIFLYVQVLKAVLFFRVIGYNQFATKLMVIAYRTLPQYITLTLLMFFVILNFALLGVQIFGDHWSTNFQKGQLHSFGDAAKAWVSVFDISTQDNWYSVYVLGTTYSNKWATIVFCFTMVLIINYLLKELLMAIILDEFSKYLNEQQHDNFNDTEEDGSDEGTGGDLVEKLDNQFTGFSGVDETFQLTSEGERVLEKKAIDRINEKQTNPNAYAIEYFRKTELKMKKNHFNLSTLLDRFTGEQRKLASYQNVECELSFLYFSKKNLVRSYCHRLLMTKWFERFFILNFIVTLTSMMALTFVDHEKDTSFFGYTRFTQQQVISATFYVNVITNSLIIVEGFINMIAFGCVYNKGAYFSDSLRGIDFLYCCIYNITLFYQPTQLQIFNYLGYLRPLRVLTMFSTFKEERKALYQSIHDILSILFVMLLFWFVFAIFGIQIYRGKMNYCGNVMNFGVGEEECHLHGHHWKTYEVNFENIFQSLIGLFIIATLDEWGPIYQVCMNGTEHGPEPFANEWSTYIFFVTFAFVGSMFFWSFFAGILFIKFRSNKAQIVSPDLTQNQLHFMRLSSTILTEKTYYSDPPRQGIRLMASRVISHKLYHHLVVFCLLANIVVLCLFSFDASAEYARILNKTHHALSAVLVMDSTIKLLNYHIIRYMGHVWRVIEFCISLHAIFDVIIDLQFNWFEFYLRAPPTDPYFVAIRVFFMLRDLRMVLIIQEFLGIQRLLHVLWYSLGTLAKLLCFFTLILMVYSFFGCKMYGLINKGEIINDQLNYSNFFYAMLTLFKVSTRNGWRIIYLDSTQNHLCHYDHDQCGPPIILSVIFYFSYMVIQNYVLMNLFILALVEQFESFYASHSSVIETYIENIDKFRNIWCKYSFEMKGTKMHTKYLAKFLLELGPPLGSHSGDNVWDAAKNASHFEIKSDRFGYVHFRELLYETVKCAFHQKIFTGGTYEGFRQMKQHDKKIRYRLQHVREPQFRREVLNPVIELKGNFNILQEYLFVFMALKAWKSYTTKFIELANEVSDSQEFTEKEEMDSEQMESEDTQSSVESEDSEPKNVSLESQSSKDNDCVYDLDLYEQQPKIRLKVSFLDRIYQQRVKDNILFSPKNLNAKK